MKKYVEWTHLAHFSVLSYTVTKFWYICHGFVSAGDALGREHPATPDVVLLRWAFKVPGDLIFIYYWGELHSVVPMGSGPCSAVLRHLRTFNALVCILQNDWVCKTVTRHKRFNLGVREFGAGLEGGDLVQQTKIRN